ncbi:unnamed protein product [Linum trigynum]|uniref:Uncharacterized protein n=1 Tax=Linum trigynum TaxID=586398 RepID=A0AAV2GJ76_9ROSI
MQVIPGSSSLLCNNWNDSLCNNWNDSLHLATTRYKTDTNSASYGRMVWMMLVSELWREYCRRLYDNRLITEEQLVKKIQDHLRILINCVPTSAVFVSDRLLDRVSV